MCDSVLYNDEAGDGVIELSVVSLDSVGFSMLNKLVDVYSSSVVVTELDSSPILIVGDFVDSPSVRAREDVGVSEEVCVKISRVPPEPPSAVSVTP